MHIVFSSLKEIKLKLALTLFLVAFFLPSLTSAIEINDNIEITITSNARAAAVYTGTKSKKKFLGYTPLSYPFYFRSDATRHRIFLSKPGYEITEHLLGSENKKQKIKLQRTDAFNIKTSGSDQQLRTIQSKVNKAVSKLFYSDGIKSKLIFPQGISVNKVGKSTVLDLPIEIIDQQAIKQLKKQNRIRNTKRRMKGLSDTVINKIEVFLKTLVGRLQTIRGLDYIQTTVLYPIASNKVIYITTRDIESFYNVSVYRDYSSGIETTTTTSGFRPVTRHSSDMTWGKEISSLRFLFPLSNVRLGHLNDDLISKGSVFIWDKKKGGDGQFLLVKPDVFQ